MSGSKKKQMQPWVMWLAGAIFCGTLLLLVVSMHVHPETTADASLAVSSITFQTNAESLLGTTNEEQLLISNLASVKIVGRGPQLRVGDTRLKTGRNVELIGRRTADCAL